MNSTLRLLLAVLIAGGAVFAIFYFQGQKEIPTEETTTEVVDNQEETTTKSKPTAPAPKPAAQTFNYTPPAPQNGTLEGVVEMGAAGFNSFIVNIDVRKRWKLEKAEWGNSLVYDRMASGQDIRSGLKQYIANMLDYGVAGKRIHFIVSSGALKVENTKKIIKELKGMGYVVNTVTPEQEGTYALQCVLPSDYSDNSFVVDIGSGNTKVSWVSGSKFDSQETYGAKYYQDETSDATVRNDVRAKCGKVPSGKTEYCFIIGGVPFAMAKEGGLKNRYSVINEASAYSGTLDGKKNECGLLIYDTIRKTTKCDNFIFDKEANFAIGFLLTR